MRARIVGRGTKSRLLEPRDGPEHAVVKAGEAVLDAHPADQIVTVDAAVGIDELQAELAVLGQTLPIAPESWGPLLRGIPGTVGGLISMNLPHALYAQCGGVKDWLLEAEVLFHGENARSGAKVVKSVAGYDAHKLFVGSRGTLGPIVRATLRTWPIAALPEVRSVVRRPWSGGDVWIARTLPSLFPAYLEAAVGVLAFDPPSCTLWAEAEPARPSEGWLVGPRGAVWPGPTAPELSLRIKRVFDPEEMWQ